MNKEGKTIRPFRYDLNQIPYDYTVEMRNRFKGLDLIDRVPDELWLEVRDIVQEAMIKTIPKKKKCTLLIVSFVVQKLLSLIRSHLFIFAFISNILGGGS